MSLEISAKFDREKLSKDQDSTGNLMISLKAPAGAGEIKRTPVSATLVLDVSGSMEDPCKDGRTKMTALKDTAVRLIKNLTSEDELSIVTFTTNVTVLHKRQKVGDKEAALRAVDKLRSQMSTNFSGGLLQGFAEAKQGFDGVQRVMLLTDGLPTDGVRDHAGLVDLVMKRDTKATLSTFGFGLNADQELLNSMAAAGGGNYYYIESSKDSKEAFARELGGISSCKAQNISVTVDPNGNEILEVLNDFNVKKDDTNEKIAIIEAEDLYLEEVKHVLLKMQVKAPVGKPKDRQYSIAHITVEYDDLETKKRESVKLNPKVWFVKEEEADKDPILEVAEQAAVLGSAAAQLKAMKSADLGDFTLAREVLQEASEDLQAAVDRGSEIGVSCLAAMNEVQQNMSAKRYSSTYGATTRASARGMQKYRGVSGQSAVMYSNVHMDNMVRNFEQEPEAENPAPAKVENYKAVIQSPPKKEEGFTKTRKRSR